MLFIEQNYEGQATALIDLFQQPLQTVVLIIFNSIATVRNFF